MLARPQSFLMHNKVKRCLKILIEEAVGHTIADNIFKQKFFYALNDFVLNEKDTLVFLQLVDKYTAKSVIDQRY
jgi:hypothetical protein